MTHPGENTFGRPRQKAIHRTSVWWMSQQLAMDETEVTSVTPVICPGRVRPRDALVRAS